MTAFDLPLDALRAYAPERTEPNGSDAFLADTLASSRGACVELQSLGSRHG